MAAIFDRNSEQGFVFASLMEFFQCWSSKHEATLSIQCKQGRASLNFTCSLGEPDQQHVEVKKVFKRKKKKSPSQINRDNSRAAARRAREETGQPIPPNSHSSSPEREPEKNNQDRSPPSASAGQEDYPMDSAWQPSELDDTRAAEYATVPLSPGSPERETLSFDTPARLVRQDEFREESVAWTNDYSEPPHPEVTRADVDISRHPTSPLSSPREEAGRPEDSKSNHSSDSSKLNSSENFSGDSSGDEQENRDDWLTRGAYRRQTPEQRPPQAPQTSATQSGPSPSPPRSSTRVPRQPIPKPRTKIPKTYF